MMKVMFKNMVSIRLAAVFTLLAAASSCSLFPDDRNNFLPDEKVYLNISDTRVDVDVNDGNYDISVIKSGKGLSEADVFLSFDSDGLDAYNILHGTSYKMAPENIINGFSEESFHFAAQDARKIVELSWDAEAMAAYLKLGKYAIPVRIQVNGLEVVQDKDFVMIVPKAQ